MTEQAIEQPGTQLTVQQRAAVALGSSEREVKLNEMATAAKEITAVTNADSYKQLHATRMTLKNTRVNIEKAAEQARTDARDFAKACIAEERRLIGIIEPEEQRLQGIQDAHDAKVEAEKQAKAEAERRRLESITQGIDNMKHAIVDAADRPSSYIEDIILGLKTYDATTWAQEFTDVAQKAQADTLAKLHEMLDAAKAREAEQAKLVAERAELDRLRAEQAEREKAEQARLAAEAGARKEAEEAAWQAELDRLARIAAEERAAKARIAAQEAEATARREQADREARAQREADEAASRAEIEEQRRKAQAEADRLAKEREAKERREREAREKKEAAEKAKREKSEAKAKAERDAAEAKERAEREAAEAAEREAKRKMNERADTVQLLELFMDSPGSAADEFAGIRESIEAYFKTAEVS